MPPSVSPRPGIVSEMRTTRRGFLAGSMLMFGSVCTRADAVAPPAPFGVLPSDRQLRWQEMETNAFLHFTVNTFTGKEWGDGGEDPSIFDPSNFDPDAILSALKAGGMKGVILTCKHHDGLCLWPTRTTEHCIRNSRWRDGKGDVVRDISRAAAQHGLKFGVYLSPWDRNNPEYGKPAYIPIYRQQLTELLTHYGEIFEVWFDGANGGNGFYGGARENRTIDKHAYYDWLPTWQLVRRLQPNAVIFSDVGPDARWVGNEKGYAGETSWATFDPVSSDDGPPAPGNIRPAASVTGTRFGAHWMPAECDVSIRPGWFWHKSENAQVKTPEQLLDLYFKSVGRGANLLLNVPPNRQGLLSLEDVRSVEEFHRHLQSVFRENLAAKAQMRASNVRGNRNRYGPHNLLGGNRDSYWATDDSVCTPELIADFGRPIRFNVIRLKEAIQLGQRIGAFALDVSREDAWTQLAQGTSVGSCRLVPLPETIEATRLRLRIIESPVCIALAEFAVFLKPE
jgi:alpha-L-fucosidase